MLIDAGRAATPEQATTVLKSLVLQVVVGADLVEDEAAQAALATAINTGARAFLGGVHVHLDADCTLTVGWMAGRLASEAVADFGGTVVEVLSTDKPTLAIARPQEPLLAGTPVLYVTHTGWVGGVVESADDLLDGGGLTSAGVAAAALGVSETFQRELGAAVPGRREVGISLWRPDLHWRDPDAVGDPVAFLPSRLWLLGLGHLGQGYAWCLGLLPYATPSQVQLGLVDFDLVVQANTATQLLVTPNHVGLRKTRVVGAALESLGFTTTIVERAFDDTFRPGPFRHEPSIALAGFDSRIPRLLLGGDRFERVIDAGIGGGPVDYLDIVVHTFPAAEDAAAAFTPRSRAASTTGLRAAYEEEIARRVADGAEEATMRCGMLDIAGISVGAAFVGAFAGALVIADLLRVLHGGVEFSVIALDLREPTSPRVVENSHPGDVAPAFTETRE